MSKWIKPQVVDEKEIKVITQMGSGGPPPASPPPT